MQEIKAKMIDANENTAKVSKIYFKDGEKVKKGDILITLETTKATEDIEAEEEGNIKYFIKEGDDVKLNQSLCLIYKTKEELEDFTNKNARIFENNIENTEIRATKKAKDLAKKLSVNLMEIKKDGIIKERDVKDFANKYDNKRKYDFYKGPFKYDWERVVIIGAGKGSGLVYDILLLEKKNPIGLIGSPIDKKHLPNIPVLFENDNDFIKNRKQIDFDTIIISIGMNIKLKSKLYNRYKEENFIFTNAIHPSSIIATEVKIGEGNIICQGVTIGYQTVINNNNWIASKVNIDHHNLLGSNLLIGPGTCTSGSVSIEDNVMIGTGCFFEPNLHIEENKIIKSGTIVNGRILDS